MSGTSGAARGGGRGAGARYQEFGSYEETSSFFNDKHGQNQQKWENSLTEGQNEAVNSYTGAGYTVMNPYLRAKEDPNFTGTVPAIDIKYARRINELTRAISKYNLPENITVYRGASASTVAGNFAAGTFNPATAKPGDVLRDYGFVSTAADESAAFNKPIRFIINVPKGRGRGAYVANKSYFGSSENEFLLQRGSAWRIDNIQHNPGQYDGEWVIRATLVV